MISSSGELEHFERACFELDLTTSSFAVFSKKLSSAAQAAGNSFELAHGLP